MWTGLISNFIAFRDSKQDSSKRKKVKELGITEVENDGVPFQIDDEPYYVLRRVDSHEPKVLRANLEKKLKNAEFEKYMFEQAIAH